MVKDLSNIDSSCTPNYIYTLKITYEVDESESLRVCLRKGISVHCAMSKEGRFETGHSANEVMGKTSNESISARELIVMVLLEDVFGGVAVIFTLISARKPSVALNPLTPTVILWFTASFVLARYPVKYCISLW